MKKLIQLLFLLFPSLLWAYDFPQIYGNPLTLNYTDRDGNSASQDRIGFRLQYDLDDPIVRCAQENGNCGYLSQYTQFQNVAKVLPSFKVFIAPGTISINVTIFTANNASFIAIARMNQSPPGDYSYLYNLTNDAYLRLNTQGFSDIQLSSGDCVARTVEGMLSISTGNINGGIETKGRWLYVIVLPIRGQLISNYVNNIVKTGLFMDWFRTADWNAFNSGIIAPIQTPVATIMPTQTPVPSAPSFFCRIFGGSYCNETAGPVSPPVPTPTPQPVSTQPSWLDMWTNLFKGDK